MRKDGYFIISVIISLVVPCLIGTIYFTKLYMENKKVSPIINMDSPIELVENERFIIINNSSNLTKKVYNFEVRYLDGKFTDNLYSIYLDLKIASESTEWDLLKDNSIIRSGDIMNKERNRVLVLPNVKIEKDQIHKYTLVIKSDNKRIDGYVLVK